MSALAARRAAAASAALCANTLAEIAGRTPRSPLMARPALAPTIGSALYSPLVALAPQGSCDRAALLAELARWPLATHDEAIGAMARRLVSEAAPADGPVDLHALSRALERGFPARPDWARQKIEVAARRLLLHFFLDAFAYVAPGGDGGANNATAAMELICRVSALAVRALIERDPHYGTLRPEPEQLSARCAALRQLHQALTGADHAALLALLVDGTLVTLEGVRAHARHVLDAAAIDEKLLAHARDLARAHAWGAPLRVDPELSARLVWLDFLVPCADGAYVLRQRSTDIERLNFVLGTLVAAPAPPPRTGAAVPIYSGVDELLRAVEDSNATLALNPGSAAADELDTLQETCLFSGSAFAQRVIRNTRGSRAAFIVRNAHLYTLHYLAEQLREMYGAAESGAPLYQRSADEPDQPSPRAPRLIIEFDPLFASEATAYLLGFVRSASARHGTHFICALRAPAPAGAPADPLTAEFCRRWWAAFAAGGLGACGPTPLDGAVLSRWLEERLVRREQQQQPLPPHLVQLETVGDWLLRARASGAHRTTPDTVFVLNGPDLLRLGTRWASGLYIVAQAARGRALVCTDQPCALLTTLLGVLPCAEGGVGATQAPLMPAAHQQCQSQ